STEKSIERGYRGFCGRTRIKGNSGRSAPIRPIRVIRVLLLFAPIVQHQYLRDVRPDQLHETLVRWVWQVDGAAGFVAESDQEAARVAARGVLHAHIRAPLEVDDLGNLARQRGKGVLDGAHLVGHRLRCEAEEDDVAQ